MRLWFGPLVVLFAVSSCTPDAVDSTPAKVLDNYIQTSFHAKSLEDKKHMENLLTGDTKTRLVSWSDEQFTKAFVETQRKFQSLKVLETKKVSDQEVDSLTSFRTATVRRIKQLKSPSAK